MVTYRAASTKTTNLAYYQEVADVFKSIDNEEIVKIM